MDMQQIRIRDNRFHQSTTVSYFIVNNQLGFSQVGVITHTLPLIKETKPRITQNLWGSNGRDKSNKRKSKSDK